MTIPKEKKIIFSSYKSIYQLKSFLEAGKACFGRMGSLLEKSKCEVPVEVSRDLTYYTEPYDPQKYMEKHMKSIFGGLTSP